MSTAQQTPSSTVRPAPGLASVVSYVVCGVLNALSLFFTISVWLLRFDSRVTEQRDGPGIITMMALVAGAVCLVALLAATVAAALRWIRWWMVWAPASAMLVAICGAVSAFTV